MNLDYMDELDTTHPLEALATKMLNNLYNGPYEKKANMVVKLAKEMHADGVINFCHWGCKAICRRSIPASRNTQGLRYSTARSGWRCHGPPEQP